MRRAAALLVALILAGCSVAGPQAPLHYAEQINSVTGSLSTDCGLLTQLKAFPPAPPHSLRVLQTSAASAVQKLAAIDRVHPGWRFDGVDMRTIVNQARTMLRSCGLKSAAALLKRESA